MSNREIVLMAMKRAQEADLKKYEMVAYYYKKNEKYQDNSELNDMLSAIKKEKNLDIKRKDVVYFSVNKQGLFKGKYKNSYLFTEEGFCYYDSKESNEFLYIRYNEIYGIEYADLTTIIIHLKNSTKKQFKMQGAELLNYMLTSIIEELN